MKAAVLALAAVSTGGVSGFLVPAPTTRLPRPRCNTPTIYMAAQEAAAAASEGSSMPQRHHRSFAGRVVSGAKRRVGGFVSNVVDRTLDYGVHPLMDRVVEPLLLEPTQRVLQRGREVGLAVVGAMIAATAHTHHAAARDLIDVRTPVGAVKTVRVKAGSKDAKAASSTAKGKKVVQAKGNNNNRGRNVVVEEKQEPGMLTKVKNAITNHPKQAVGVAVASAAVLYAWKRKADNDRMYASLDDIEDELYLQEDDLPKARHLAKNGHLGDITDKKVEDIDRAAAEGRASNRGKDNRDPNMKKLPPTEQVIRKEYKKEESAGVSNAIRNLFSTPKRTRMVEEQELLFAGVDGERRDGAFLMTAAQAVNAVSPVKMSIPTIVAEAEGTAPAVPVTADANGTSSSSPSAVPWDFLVRARDDASLSPQEAADAFANAVNVAVIRIVDDMVPTLKGPDAQTNNKVEGLLQFMDTAGQIFGQIAPNVTDITPVTYQGKTPARKLEMIYSRYCQHALVDLDMEEGTDKASRIQQLFDISDKKADKITQQIMKSQDNFMKILEKQMGSLGGEEGMGDLTKMLESLKDGGPMPDMSALEGMAGMGGMPGGGAGVPPMKEVQETLEALRSVVSQGGLSQDDIEELRKECASQGVDLDDLVNVMENYSSGMPAESQELAKMFKKALGRS